MSIEYIMSINSSHLNISIYGLLESSCKDLNIYCNLPFLDIHHNLLFVIYYINSLIKKDE